MSSPNKRVQRTRSSASPPHSPLTRKPLGNPNSQMCAWLAMVFLTLLASGNQLLAEETDWLAVFGAGSVHGWYTELVMSNPNDKTVTVTVQNATEVAVCPPLSHCVNV